VSSLERTPLQRWASAALALLFCTFVLAGPFTAPARAQIGPGPTACQLPVVGNVCDAVSGAVSGAAAAAGDLVMRGVTTWVTNTAVWVTGKVGDLVENTASPDLTANWFEGQYGAMLGVAGALALVMLMLAVIQSVIRQDAGMLVRSAFGYLPMAFILAGVAIAATGLLVAITDDISAAVVGGLGTKQSDNLLQAVGDAYKNALDESSGIPLFAVFLGALVLAIGAFVLWFEMIIRDAAIYICVFFLPLTFVAMIWPATSRWARRLVELLVAIILAKFVIVAILSLATAAIANTNAVSGDGNTFEQMIAGAALLVLAAWSPFALLRMIPMMEVAAASVGGQRSSMSAAAGSAGVHSPAAYMRQAMDRSSRPSASPGSAGAPRTVYARALASTRGTPSGDEYVGTAAESSPRAMHATRGGSGSEVATVPRESGTTLDDERAAFMPPNQPAQGTRPRTSTRDEPPSLPPDPPRRPPRAPQPPERPPHDGGSA
jgi:TrbL/VirB6 plasmid conjugal transfer protein